MRKIFKFIYRNLFNLLLIIGIVIYLLIDTGDVKSAAAVVCALYIILSSMILSPSLLRSIFYEKVSARVLILENKIALTLFVASSVLVYLLAGWFILSGFLIGAGLFLLFWTLIFIIKKKLQR